MNDIHRLNQIIHRAATGNPHIDNVDTARRLQSYVRANFHEEITLDEAETMAPIVTKLALDVLALELSTNDKLGFELVMVEGMPTTKVTSPTAEVAQLKHAA